MKNLIARIVEATFPLFSLITFFSLSPTAVHGSTTCIDEQNWATYDSNNVWSGKTCADIAELSSFWCSYLEEYPSQESETSSKEACCACNGGTNVTLDDSFPSEPPSDSPTQCQDEPDFFWNTDDPNNPRLGCDKLTLSFCDDLSKIWSNGKNVMTACCACGGGAHVAVPPSDMPSSNPSIEPTTDHSNMPSVVPTALVSATPSAVPSTLPTTETYDSCSDFADFATYDPSGFWSSHTCAQVSELPSFWCGYLEEFPNANNVTTVDACCACGGGNKVEVVRSRQPSEAPSAAPTQCVDQPDWFWDGQHTCEKVTPAFCNTLSSIWYKGKNVQLACCACGGGEHVPYVPSSVPSSEPSISHQPSTSELPSIVPTLSPSTHPSTKPSGIPTSQPTSLPSVRPSAEPSLMPSVRPSSKPSIIPSLRPTSQPSVIPTDLHSLEPTTKPSSPPSELPTFMPSSTPSSSVRPSAEPSLMPSVRPSSKPSIIPSLRPTSQPSVIPTDLHSLEPTTKPSSPPSELPTFVPSSTPSLKCYDHPDRWYDVEGEKFNCLWYSDKQNCEFYGNEYENFGFTANEACCVCGGGVTNASPSEEPSLSPSQSQEPSSIPSNVPELASGSDLGCLGSSINPNIPSDQDLNNQGWQLIAWAKPVGGMFNGNTDLHPDKSFGSPPPAGTTDLTNVNDFQIKYRDLLNPSGNDILFITGNHKVWGLMHWESAFPLRATYPFSSTRISNNQYCCSGGNTVWKSCENDGLGVQKNCGHILYRPASEDPWISIAHGDHGIGYNGDGRNRDPSGNVVDLMVWGEVNYGNEGRDLKNAHGGMKVYIRARQSQGFDQDNIGVCPSCGDLCDEFV